MAVLCVLDDNGEDGEWLRLRSPRVVLGRSEGDVCVPHDEGMSVRHAELERRVENGRFRWYLRDLQSRNGVFWRVSHMPLAHGQELLLGSRRYRFNTAPQGGPAAPTAGVDPKSTRGWQAVYPAQLPYLLPALEELAPTGAGRRFLLAQADNWIGTDAACEVVIADDPFLSARHARLTWQPDNSWRLQDRPSLNGVWLRVREIPLDVSGEFLLGEQRFLVRIP